MRTPIVAAMLLATLAQSAPAAQRKVAADPLVNPSTAETNPGSTILMGLQELESTLRASGFKDVQVMPEAILVQAKTRFDKPVVLIVDTKTMTAVQLRITPDDDTTGSGSADDR